jgi:DNA (cytosine-5)-methyltransferase 1
LRRKDGLPKAKATRKLPTFSGGFRDNRSVLTLPSEPRHSVVSLFAGCGGLDLGIMGGFSYLGTDYEATDFDVVYAADNSADAVETYKLNLGDEIHLQDLTQVSPSDLPAGDVLMGGFPCQDFSSSGPKVGFSGARGQLYEIMIDYMREHRPKLVIGENVPHLARLQGGRYLDQIVRDIEGEGYRCQVWNLYAPDYGLPQSRRRLIIVGVRDDLPGFPERPVATHTYRHVPIDSALCDLEPIVDETIPNQSQFFIASRASSGGGQGDHVNQVGTVAYCIRANARGRIQFHYSLDRRLTVRECARLQAFPDEFVFPFTTQRNLTLVGNAVPPILGHAVARSMSAYLAEPAAFASPSSSSDVSHEQLELLAQGC